MFAGIRRRKQKRPQHLTELTDGSEEVKFVAMSDSETDRRSKASTACNKEPWRENKELVINEDDAVTEDSIFAAQRSTSDREVEEEVVLSDGKEDEEEEARRGSCSPFRSKTTSSISAQPQRIVDELREKRSPHSDGAVDRGEAGFFRRDLSYALNEGDGVNILRSFADFYDDRRTLPTGSGITAAENYVIGKESHVTKLQSFVESLNDDPRERGSRFLESPSFVSGSFPPLLLPRLKPVYWTRHNGCSSLQANSAYDTASSRPSSVAAKTHSSPGTATADGPLDLSTKRFVSSESGVRDSRQFEAQRMKIWGRRGENFERSDRSTHARNLRFLPFVSANQSNIKATHDLTELSPIASFLQLKDRWPNTRPDLKRRRDEINFHDSSTTDVASYLLKSQSPETSENGNRKRQQRGLSSQENSAKRRKSNTTEEDLANVDGRNSLRMRSHRGSKCSGRPGKRGKDPVVGLGGESLQTIDEETKREEDTAASADLLRTECTCGMTFESLYRLAVHIQKSGHVPENHHRSDSSKPFCGLQDTWIPGEEHGLQTESATLEKHIQRSTELNGSVIYTGGGQLTGATGSDPTHQRHGGGGSSLITTDESDVDLDGRNSAMDRNLRLLFNLHSRLDVANGRRETAGEEEAGFNETDRNSAVFGIRRKLMRKRDEALMKKTSKESPSDGNEMSSINDHSSRDDNEQLKTSEQMIRSVASRREDTFSAEVDESDQPPSIARYVSDRIYQEPFASPHSPAAILAPENAVELPPPPLVRAASSTVCRLAAGSDSPSAAADDHSKPVSRLSSSSRSSESKERERRTTRSGDRPSGVSKTPKSRSTGERRRIVINETTSSAVGGVNESTAKDTSESQVALERIVIMNSDRQRSTGRRRRRNARKTNEQKFNPREKQSSSSSSSDPLLLCKRRFPGVAPQQVLAAGSSVGDTTRRSAESPVRTGGFDLPFVLPPSSDHVDGSFSLWAMKKFVDDHFCAQSNAHLTTEGSTLQKNNYRITSDDTSTTWNAESRCSNNFRRLTTTKILQESLTVKNLQALPSHRQNSSDILFGDSFNSDAALEEQKDSKGNAKDIREQNIEDLISGSRATDHDNASDTDLSARVLHSSRLQGQFSDDESSSMIADGPRNGVTAVQSSETTTTTTIGKANSSVPECAEKCADVAGKIPPAVFTKKKKKSSEDEGEFTGDCDKKTRRLPTPEETNLISSSSSAFPGVDDFDEEEEEDEDSDGNSAADEAVDRFLCSESQLEQVC